MYKMHVCIHILIRIVNQMYLIYTYSSTDVHTNMYIYMRIYAVYIHTHIYKIYIRCVYQMYMYVNVNTYRCICKYVYIYMHKYAYFLFRPLAW